MNISNTSETPVAINELLTTSALIKSESDAVAVVKKIRLVMDKHLVSNPLKDYLDDSDLDVSEYNSGKRVQKPWVSTIAIELAELNDCVVAIAGGVRSNLRYEFKGFKADADLCVLMTSYLIDMCDSIYDNSKGMLGLSGLSDKNDFYAVVATTMKNSLKQAQDERAEFLCADDDRGNNHNQRVRMVSKEYGKTAFQPIKTQHKNRRAEITTTKSGFYATPTA